MRERFIQVNNLKVFTRIVGQGNPFLILPGWGRGHISWLNIQDELSKHFQVIVLDLPGFGKSDKPSWPWALDDYAQFVLDFLKQLNLDRVYLLGHSFGGSIAIKLAVNSPEFFKKLILVDSAGKRPKKKFIKKVLVPAVSRAKKLSNLPGYNIFRKFFYKYILKSTDYLKAEGVMKQVFQNVVKEDLSALWEKITLETLIIWGRLDKTTPLKDGYSMNKAIKSSRLELLDCQHLPQAEAPEELVKKILDFLKNES